MFKKLEQKENDGNCLLFEYRVTVAVSSCAMETEEKYSILPNLLAPLSFFVVRSVPVIVNVWLCPVEVSMVTVILGIAAYALLTGNAIYGVTASLSVFFILQIKVSGPLSVEIDIRFLNMLMYYPFTLTSPITTMPFRMEMTYCVEGEKENAPMYFVPVGRDKEKFVDVLVVK